MRHSVVKTPVPLLRSSFLRAVDHAGSICATDDLLVVWTFTFATSARVEG